MLAMGHLARGEIFENMLKLMSFCVYFERIVNTNNDYFHIEIMISVAHTPYGVWRHVPIRKFETML